MTRPVDFKERNVEYWLTVRRAMKLWRYIEQRRENGVKIRLTGAQGEEKWEIADPWNETTEGAGKSLDDAVDNLPDNHRGNTDAW